MFFKLSHFVVLALGAVTAVGNPLETRQAVNTNVAVNRAVSGLSKTTWSAFPALLKNLAGSRTTPATLNPLWDQVTRSFTSTATIVALTPISAGSTTAMPTNDDISVMYGNILFQLAGTVSGFINPNVNADIPAKFAALDTAAATMSTNLNRTVPNSVAFVHIAILDARQFLAAANFTKTLAAIGF